MPRYPHRRNTTINAIISADAQGTVAPAARLFARLKFPDCRAHVLNSVESVLPDGAFPSPNSAHVIAEMIDSMEAAGEKAVTDIATLLGGDVTTSVVQGDPLRNILDLADEDDAALIVVGDKDRTSLEKVLLGSVPRGLLTKSRHSFLVGKAYGTGEGPITAIFATDHSEYCDRCADLLISMKPAGIAKLIVLSVLDAEVVPDSLVEGTNLLAERFANVFSQVEAIATTGEVEPTMHNTMVAQNAELMIVGAQGHSFLARLFKAGSTSYHQVENEPYSTLVLRPLES